MWIVGQETAISGHPVKGVLRCAVGSHCLGVQWSRKRILIHCDNHAVVDIWRFGTSKHRALMHLVQSLFFTAAKHNYTELLKHIPGVDNSIADSLPLSAPQVSRPSSRRRLTRHTHPCSQDLSMTQSLDSLQALGVAPFMRRTYRAGVRHYKSFCN